MTSVGADLSLPVRNKTHLSLVKHTKADMSMWVNNLPIMNAAESGKQLYQTITELSALAIEEELRFELLEVLQPTIHNLIKTLEKYFLNQPLLLSVQGRRVFALVLALRRNLALNYKIVAIQTLKKLQGRIGFMNLGRRKAQQLAATSIQRTIAELQCLLLDSYRQYEHVSEGIWSDIHTLCRVAAAQELMDIPCTESMGQQQPTSIRHAYLCAIVLAASQINKLRPAEMELVYRYSHDWANLLTINSESENSLLVCNLNDQPPLFHHLATTHHDSWFIHSAKLAEHFQSLMPQSSGVLSLSLITHLFEAWSATRERMFERATCHKHILLCLGMSSAHYFVGDQTEFKLVVKGEEKKEEVKQPAFLFGLDEGNVLKEQPDAWQICYGLIEAVEIDEVEEVDLPPVPTMTYMPYRVTAQNRCPGGYGLAWPAEPPTALRVGEIIGMSEQRGHGWGVGVVHWLHQTSERTITVGVELLAAHPKPCGVCLVNKQTTSDYMRGFLIPEMRSLEQPASIITPNSGLTMNSIVKISLNGQEVVVQLTKQILATQSMSQFEFALLNTDKVEKVDAVASQESDDIDSLWASL